ncbi:MAG: hypothetical protein JRI34_11540, partial [Deltaproteobacteria bacterium]|nr:hypothetical protein [Deltaproteobacteria bacterium]
MNLNSKHGLKAFLILAILLVFFTGCAVQEVGVKIGDSKRPKGRPPAHAPAHGHRAKF